MAESRTPTPLHRTSHMRLCLSAIAFLSLVVERCTSSEAYNLLNLWSKKVVVATLHGSVFNLLRSPHAQPQLPWNFVHVGIVGQKTGPADSRVAERLGQTRCPTLVRRRRVRRLPARVWTEVECLASVNGISETHFSKRRRRVRYMRTSMLFVAQVRNSLLPGKAREATRHGERFRWQAAQSRTVMSCAELSEMRIRE